MSLQHAAKHLAAQGRGPDTELIHMTKGEIAGLQALAKAHGGSLTVNPHTGLAEAGFLSNILPMAIGAGITYLSGGTIPAWQIGLGMGAVETARTGNLGKGLMAGLGAYGGAGLTEGLAGVGTSEAGANISQAVEEQQRQAVEKAMAERAAEQASAAQAGSLGAPGVYGEALSPEQIANIRNTAAQNFKLTPELQSQIDNRISTGFNAALKDPSKFVTGMGGYGSLAKTGLMAAAPMLAGSMTPKQAVPIQTQGDTDLGQKYSYSPGVASPFPQASPTGVEQNYFPGQGYTKISAADAKALYGYADGGDVQFPYGESVMRMRSGGLSDFDAPTKPKVADRDSMKKPAGLSDMAGLDDMEDLRKTKGLYAAGGLSDLGGYSDGGRLLRGPGDGVSDSIPATIGNKQPARLADGEFVVPARIVSELGNGSTDAGARQLYKMMDRVQKARGKTVGKGKVAKNSRADRFLPA